MLDRGPDCAFADVEADRNLFAGISILDPRENFLSTCGKIGMFLNCWVVEQYYRSDFSAEIIGDGGVSQNVAM